LTIAEVELAVAVEDVLQLGYCSITLALEDEINIGTREFGGGFRLPGGFNGLLGRA
jgi:hypothetical protein